MVFQVSKGDEEENQATEEEIQEDKADVDADGPHDPTHISLHLRTLKTQVRQCHLLSAHSTVI